MCMLCSTFLLVLYDSTQEIKGFLHVIARDRMCSKSCPEPMVIQFTRIDFI